MALDAKIVGSTSGNGQEVDVNNQAKVITNTDVTKAGFMRIASENDAGTITGTAYCLSPETSDDYRLRSGLDVIEFNDTFDYTNQDTGKYAYLSTTMTQALSGGALTTNATSITTINTATSMRTWKLFPLLGQQTPLYCECSASLTAALTTNTTIDFGLFTTSGASPYAPNDGVYFRITSAGFFGVTNFNGVETTTSVFTFTSTINRVYQFLLTFNEREVEFWIDDVLYGTIPVPVGQGQPCMSATLPMQWRHAIGGTAAGAVLQFKLRDISVQLGDIGFNMPFGVQQAMMGQGLQVQQAATTGGQLTTYALGAEPAAVTLTASTAPATNTLGGLFTLPTAITPAASDYPLFAWLNPAGTTAIHGKVFICTGVRIGEICPTTALTGGPLVLKWSLGFGSTASSLATTESTTFSSGTTKIARKIPLGQQVLPATMAVGTAATGFSVDFGNAPIVINPGEYLHIILRVPGGTATSAGVPTGSVAVFGYFR